RRFRHRPDDPVRLPERTLHGAGGSRADRGGGRPRGAGPRVGPGRSTVILGSVMRRNNDSTSDADRHGDDARGGASGGSGGSSGSTGGSGNGGNPGGSGGSGDGGPPR